MLLFLRALFSLHTLFTTYRRTLHLWIVYDSSRLDYVRFVPEYDQLRILRSKRGNGALNNAEIEQCTTVQKIETYAGTFVNDTQWMRETHK